MLNVSTSNMLNPGVEAAHDDPSQMDVSRLFSAIKQQRKLIYSWVLSVLGIGVLYLLLATPVFKASSTIFIDTQTSRAMEKQDLNAVETPVLTDTSFVDSEVEVLSSDGMALKVVRALDLASDPEFVGPHPGIIGWISSQISGAIKFVISLFTAPGPDNPELRAVDAFGRKLVVKRIGLTYIITITVSSETGEKAAKIANSLTDLYLKGVLEAKYGATRQTGDWLQSRLAAIQRQVTDAARAV
jgi:succinoglycan biosynthesis transport protein ExoP